jgi:phosphate transport system permease protein
VSTLESDRAETTARTVSRSRRATRRRMLVDKVMTALTFVALALAIAPLIMILADVLVKGMPVMNLSFLTNLPTPVGVQGGGIANALVGTFVMVGIATLISVPIGMGAGIFFSEWPESRLSLISSFMNDVLAEFPSIVIGIFVYVVIVLTTHSFSAVAGAVALSIIMIPVIARTTEESLKIVPVSLREASLALGVSRWRTVIRVVISTAKTGLVTGILLAVARAAGETAPLILTALGSTLYATGLFQPTAAVPLLIYQYGISPFADWQARAWGAALVLVIIMLALNLSVKFVVGRKFAGIRAET